MSRLRSTGRISLGVNDDAAPVAYLGPGNEHMGYHVDVCKRIVQAIAQRYEMPGLKTVTVPINQASRLATLNNGTVDILCGHNPINVASLQQGLFAHATLVTQMRAMVTADNKALTIDTLAGRNVVVTVGGVAVGRLRAHLRKSQLKINEVFGRTTDGMIVQLDTQKGDALILPEPYLWSLRARSDNPARYHLLDGAFGSDTMAVMFRTGDDKLVAVANDTIASMMRSGEMERIYRKWFLELAPGYKVPLGFELSPQLRALFADPGSEMAAF